MPVIKIKENMSPDERTKFGGGGDEPRIFRGVINNDLGEIDEALRNDRDCINSRHPDSGMTPLSLSIALQNTPLIEHLSAQPRVNPLIKDFGDEAIGRPPFDSLDWANFIGHKIVKSIVRKAVNPSLALKLEQGDDFKTNISPFSKFDR